MDFLVGKKCNCTMCFFHYLEQKINLCWKIFAPEILRLPPGPVRYPVLPVSANHPHLLSISQRRLEMPKTSAKRKAYIKNLGVYAQKKQKVIQGHLFRDKELTHSQDR